MGVLVIDALLHDEGGIDVMVGDHGNRVRLAVEVEGFGPEPIRFKAPTSVGGGGWGLGPVDELSDSSGAHRVLGRTPVWIERRVARASSGAGRAAPRRLARARRRSSGP